MCSVTFSYCINIWKIYYYNHYCGKHYYCHCYCAASFTIAIIAAIIKSLSYLTITVAHTNLFLSTSIINIFVISLFKIIMSGIVAC